MSTALRISQLYHLLCNIKISGTIIDIREHMAMHIHNLDIDNKSNNGNDDRKSNNLTFLRCLGTVLFFIK